MGRRRTQLDLSPAERREALRLVRSGADPRVEFEVNLLFHLFFAETG